jgi:hypothetical protein
MIENKQQTALEWYDNEIEKLFNQFTIDKINIYEFRTKRFKLIEQAKEMEKERIETAYNKGTVHGIDYPESILPITGEQYYNETYGGGEQ